MDDDSSFDYKSLPPEAKQQLKQAKEELRHEADLRRQAEEKLRRTTFAEEQIRRTTFIELIKHGHNSIASYLEVADESRCTKGKISAPIGKKCPVKLLPWKDCQSQQEEIYRSVCRYLASRDDTAPRLFASLHALEYEGEKVKKRPLSSEQDLEIYERSAVEDHVRDIIAELRVIPDARREFHLGDEVRFDNHVNSPVIQQNQLSKSNSSRPDQFFIYRVDDGTSTILTTIEYKPPHKLPVKSLREGLKPMYLFRKVAKAHAVSTTEEKSERLAGAVIAQQYNVMIQEGLEYSYVTNGLALILLRIPCDEPGTLYYHLCEPSMEVNPEDDQSFLQPVTAIARVLCLCLMSFRSRPRNQQWRNEAQAQLPVWKSSFDGTRSPDSETESSDTTKDSQHTHPSPKSPSAESPDVERHRESTPYRHGCPSFTATRHDDSSDPDSGSQAPGQRKRGFSQVDGPSLPAQRLRRQTTSQTPDSQPGQHTARFCTQRCLYGLQRGGLLDDACPNVMLHKEGGDGRQHAIDSTTLVQLVKRQLDDNLDRNCTPMGGCGASGAPFKVTSAVYGYTIVGKGTTSYLWPELLREAEVYRVLQQVQGSAVPIFLGAIDLEKTYFLHGAGPIQHMLLMGWGGKPVSSMKNIPSETGCNEEALNLEISESVKKIRSLGVQHKDLRLDNILWNAELRRPLIIDFHLVKLNRRLNRKQLI
ncbi:hypothetical protein KEM54_000952 [Ascosphaera aggregata]|nr:hypothetical protein KEM54_000952 [Ascosphaera aggregata]